MKKDLMRGATLFDFCLKFEIKMDSAQTKRAQAATFLVASLLVSGVHAQTAASPDKEPSLAYTIRQSDSLIKFGRDTLVSPQAWPEIARFNRLKNPNLIFPGQNLDIPLRFLKSQPAGGKVISAEGNVMLGNGAAMPGAAIGDGNTLKTGPNSSAVIELGDGSRIKILPNSLAEVVTNRHYAMRDASVSGSTNWFSGLMRLSEGALEALASKTTQRATPLKIETPTSVVGVRGTEFRVAFDDSLGKAARTEVMEGQVRADNPAQQSGADLPMGTGAVIRQAEKNIQVVQLLPAPDLSAVTGEVLKPGGNWPMPALAGATGFHVQVASDERFDKIVRDLKVSAASTDLKVSAVSADLSSLPIGNWYARVRGIDAVGLEGFNSVKLIAVKEGQWKVTYSGMSVVDGKTTLGWTGQHSAGQAMPGGSYSAVLARDTALTQSVVNLQTAGNSTDLILGDLKPGIYFIRLQNDAGVRSEVYRFELSGNWGITVFAQTSALQAVK